MTEEELRLENERLRQQNAELQTKVNWFEEQLRLSRHRQFGSSSEKTPPEQLNLFNEAESEALTTLPEPTAEDAVPACKKTRHPGQREERYENLPEEIVEYRLEADKQVCECCGGALHPMSTRSRQEIVTIPAKKILRTHVTHLYACRHCEKDGLGSPVVEAPSPAPLIPKSLASASGVADILVQKFMQGVPLYRQEAALKQQGILLSRQTLSNWLIRCHELYFGAVFERMKYYLLQRDILHADETTLQVLREPGRPAVSESYVWLYRTGTEGPGIVLYEYQTARASKYPKAFLKEFRGWLQTDGYLGYEGIPNVTLVGCWAHARRKFDEALKVLPAEARNKDSLARSGLAYCNQLYALANELENCSAEEREKARRDRCPEIFEEFRAWLKKARPHAQPKSPLGAAITHCLNQWDKLTRYPEDGRLEIDNNRAERAIKPFVIGRKNWLFSNTPNGARASTTIYSLIETAKENSLNVLEYLAWLLEQVPQTDMTDSAAVDLLLPWSEKVPENLRVAK